MLTFNINRVKSLFIREFHLGFKPAIKVIVIITTAIFLFNLVASAIIGHSPNNSDPSGTIIKYGLLLLIGGFFYASVAFREFRNVPLRAEFLALPGSSLEKVFVKWTVTNPIFLLVFTIFFWVIASILMPFIANLRGFTYANDLFVVQEFWNLVGIFFILHSIFFFGSIAFNKVPIVLTIASVVVIGLVVALLSGLWLRIVWADFFDTLFTFSKRVEGLSFGVNYNDPTEMWQLKFFSFAFKYLLAPVLWVASIFKFSEKQV